MYDFRYFFQQLCSVCFRRWHQSHFLLHQIDFRFFCFRHFSHGFFDFSRAVSTGQALQGNGHFSLRLFLFHKGYFHITFILVYGFCYFFQQFCPVCFCRRHQSHFLFQQIDFRFFRFRHFSHGFFDFSRTIGTGQAFQGNGHFSLGLLLFHKGYFHITFVFVYSFCYFFQQFFPICFRNGHQPHLLFQQIDFRFFRFRHFSHGFFDFSRTIGTGQAFQGNGHFSLGLLLFHKGYFHVTFILVYRFCYFFQQFCPVCFCNRHQTHFLLQQIDFRFFCFWHFSHGFFNFPRAVGTGQPFQGYGHFFHGSHL